MKDLAVLALDQTELPPADWPKIFFYLVTVGLMFYFAVHLARAWYETIRMRLWRSPHMNQLVGSTALWVFFVAMGVFCVVQRVAAKY